MKRKRIMTYIGLIIVSFIIISISGANAKFTYNSAKESVSDNQNNIKPEFNMTYDGDDVSEDGKILLEILFEDKAYPYKDGMSYSIYISSQLPDDVTVSYSNNNQSQIGTYTVIATFSGNNDKYLLPESVSAKLTIYDQSEYEYEVIDNSYVNITKYNGTKLSSLVVPSTFYVDYNENGEIVDANTTVSDKTVVRTEEYSVKTISENTFSNHTELKSITIPSGVISMGKGILSSCSNLEEISIPFIGETQENNTYLSHLW